MAENKTRKRVLASLLTVSAMGFAAWQADEHFVEKAMIPTKGDVPTVGFGSTKYEDGRPVRMGDRITRQRAEELAKNLLDNEYAKCVAASVPGLELYQEEMDFYANFAGQFGCGNWRKSGMRRRLAEGDYLGACEVLLEYRFAAGYDCSTVIDGKRNTQCWGVWTRQQERHAKCVKAAS